MNWGSVSGLEALRAGLAGFRKEGRWTHYSREAEGLGKLNI